VVLPTPPFWLNTAILAMRLPPEAEPTHRGGLLSID
jgi:hypothetical protein